MYDEDIYKKLEGIILYIASDLSINHISLLCSSIDQGKLYKVSISILCSLRERVNREFVAFIFSKFSVDSCMQIEFAKDFTMHSLESSEYSLEFYPLDYFKKLLGDEYHDYHTMAIISIAGIYSHFAFNTEIETEVKIIIKEIITCIRVVQNIRLILLLHENGFRLRNMLHQKHVAKVVDCIKKATELVGHTHEENIQSIFDYIELLLKLNKSISLLDFLNLWETFASNTYSHIFFSWLEKCLVYFPPEFTVTIFKEFFRKKLSFQELSLSAFHCFFKIFLVINSYERFIELKQGLFQIRLQQQLKYFPAIIEIALQADESIFKECARILVPLNTRLSGSLIEKRKLIWDHFFGMIMAKSREENYGRALSLILYFIEPACTTQNIPMLFIFKTCEELEYNSVYIEESATIRELKRKIGRFYHRDINSVVIVSYDTKYDRFNDELHAKSMKSFSLDIVFEDNEDISIESYISESKTIQQWTISVLGHDKNYSEIALKILNYLHIDCNIALSLRELTSSPEDIIGRSYYTFIFSLSIIENLSVDTNWIMNFDKIGGIEYVITEYLRHDSTDFGFNQLMISVGELFTRYNSEITNEQLISRVLESLSSIALYEIEEIISSAEKAYKIIEYNLSLDSETLLTSLCLNNKYRILLKNCLILSCDKEFSKIIFSILLKLCLRLPELARVTVEQLLSIIEETQVHEFNHNYSFDLLSRLLVYSDSHQMHLGKLEVKLKQGLDETSTIVISGTLSCVKSLFAIVTFENIEVLVNMLCLSNESMRFPPIIYGNLLEIMMSLSKSSNEYCEFVLNLLIKFIPVLEIQSYTALDWYNSMDSIYIKNYPFRKLKNSAFSNFLNTFLYQLFAVFEFRVEILELNSLKKGSLLWILQNLFKKISSSTYEIISSKRLLIYLLNQQYHNKYLLNPIKFFKTFLKSIKQEYDQITKTKKLIFEGTYRYQFIAHGKLHKNIEEKHTNFIYLKSPLMLRNISKIFELMSNSNESENDSFCKVCEKKCVVEKKCIIQDLPKILIIAIERFKSDRKGNFIKSDEYCEFPVELGINCEERGSGAEANSFSLYRLCGITVHKRKIDENYYTAYTRIDQNWTKISNSAIKIIHKNKIEGKFFGNKCIGERKIHKNAIILIYEKIGDKSSELLSNNPTTLNEFFPIELNKNFIFSEGLYLFVQELLKIPNYECLKFAITYFFFVLLRTNSIERILSLVESIIPELTNDPKLSEWLLNLIRNEPTQSFLFFQCPDSLKGKIIIELVYSSIESARPSTNLRLLTTLLNRAYTMNSLFSDSYSEIIYIICKKYPTLAAEEKTAAKLLEYLNCIKINTYDLPRITLETLKIHPASTNMTDLRYPLTSISSFILNSLSLFAEFMNSEEKEALVDMEMIQLINSSKQSRFSASEISKLYLKINFGSKKNLLLYIDILAYCTILSKESLTRTYFTQLECILQFMNNPELLQIIVDKIFQIEEHAKNYLCSFYLIDCLANTIYANESMKNWMYSQSKRIEYLDKKLKSSRFLNWIQESNNILNNNLPSHIDLIKKLKNKDLIHIHEPRLNYYNNNRGNIIDVYNKKTKSLVKVTVIRHLQSSAIVRLGSKYHIFDYLNEELIL